MERHTKMELCGRDPRRRARPALSGNRKTYSRVRYYLADYRSCNHNSAASRIPAEKRTAEAIQIYRYCRKDIATLKIFFVSNRI